MKRGSAMAFVTHPCGAAPIVVDGETVCPACGVVLEAGCDDGRPVGGSEANPRRKYGGLGTELDWRMPPLQKQLDLSARPSAEKGMVQHIRRINAACSKMGLPEPVAVGAVLACRRFKRAGRTHSKPSGALAAACVFWACRRAGIPRKLSEVACVLGVGESPTFKTYWRLLKHNPSPEPPMASRFVPGIVGELGLPPSVERRAANILSKLPPTAMAGFSPKSVAAAAVCMAGDGLTRVEVARAAGVSAGTLGRLMRLLERVLGARVG